MFLSLALHSSASNVQSWLWTKFRTSNIVCCSLAKRSPSSRKLGWAILTQCFNHSRMLIPHKFPLPCSVALYRVWDLFAPLHITLIMNLESGFFRLKYSWFVTVYSARHSCQKILITSKYQNYSGNESSEKRLSVPIFGESDFCHGPLRFDRDVHEVAQTAIRKFELNPELRDGAQPSRQ